MFDSIFGSNFCLAFFCCIHSLQSGNSHKKAQKAFRSLLFFVSFCGYFFGSRSRRPGRYTAPVGAGHCYSTPPARFLILLLNSNTSSIGAHSSSIIPFQPAWAE